ncbi:MAG TPA: metallophosphoesterase family protein [Sandaracinaceae bacterium LLY-WYZ-13_1]|nr:metallophosphoesterase family protein [Sandaracinaceae bacterium LLY-WYZ-13_1]
MSVSRGRQGPANAPMAFLSDVHGNLLALESVLHELRQRMIDEIYVAGDLLLGGDEPVEVFKRLQQAKAQCVKGVSDRALIRVDPESLAPADEAQVHSAVRFRRTREAIGELALKYLEKLPDKIRIPMVDGSEILVVHGSPLDPTTEMSADLTDEELERLVDDDPAEIILCGASHVPFSRVLSEHRVVNVGSVGAAPEGRVAHYTILTPRMDGTLIEQTWVEY